MKPIEPIANIDLAAADLLAPELPKGKRIRYPEDILEWRPVPGLPKAVIWAGDQNRPIMIQNVEPGDLTPEEAEALGLALLAAAQHAKEKQ